MSAAWVSAFSTFGAGGTTGAGAGGVGCGSGTGGVGCGSGIGRGGGASGTGAFGRGAYSSAANCAGPPVLPPTGKNQHRTKHAFPRNGPSQSRALSVTPQRA